ncbi:ribonuclease P protein component [Terribacillus sp. 7520-G]|uniref:ribonuclease P protein component n=1 Tax=Terribacillus TaxID=459532 RepID=UPI000BA6DA2E|nr:ribonuclease P protein component [Terribacillus sp. 7520-G]PAD38819.1 ribonuclease P protein component [Terribacillus sp. 7520-G]
MKKEYRIKKNEAFQEVFQKGSSFANRQLVLYYKRQETADTHFRIGLSVSKKLGNAVMRNKIKRYLRQAFHELDEQVVQGYDFIVIARQPAKDMTYQELKKSLIHVLWKSHLLKQPNRKQKEKQ